MPKLVWRMNVTPVGHRRVPRAGARGRELGNVALNFDQVENALNRKTYTAHGTSALPGRLLCTETTNRVREVI